MLETTLGVDRLTECQVASDARFCEFGTCACGDAVLWRCDGAIVAGKVMLHACCDGVPVSILTQWSLVSYNGATCAAVWRAANKTEIVGTVSILAPLIYTSSGHNEVRTLIPMHGRALFR